MKSMKWKENRFTRNSTINKDLAKLGCLTLKHGRPAKDEALQKRMSDLFIKGSRKIPRSEILLQKDS